MQPDIERGQRLEDHREEDGAEPDPELESRVGGQNPAPAVDGSPDPEAAQRKAGHERRKHGADGQDRVAEQQMKHAGPHDFVEEAARAGEKTQSQHDARPHPADGSGRGNRHGSIRDRCPIPEPGRTTIAELPGEGGFYSGNCSSSARSFYASARLTRGSASRATRAV